MKSDTRGTFNGQALPNLFHKVMKLESEGNELLIGFCGALNFNGKDTYDHIKNEEKKLFQLYNNTEVIGSYLKGLLNPKIKNAVQDGEIQSSNNLIIHIISKRDFDNNNPFICKVIIDYRENPPKVTCGIFGYDEIKGFQIIWSGADEAQQIFIDSYPEEGREFESNDYAATEQDLDGIMKSAIAAASDACGEPIETFCFTI